FYQSAIQSRDELDYNRYVKQAGLAVDLAQQSAAMYLGIQYERSEANQVRITRVIANSPAERAKLDGGDILVAMNDERLTYDNFVSRLHTHAIGETIKLTIMRGQRWLTVNLFRSNSRKKNGSLKRIQAQVR